METGQIQQQSKHYDILYLSLKFCLYESLETILKIPLKCVYLVLATSTGAV